MGITDDLAATQRRVSNLIDDIDVVKATYQSLVSQLADLDLQVQRIEGQENAKKEELGVRKAQLADRVREAYEAERTSMLETFLSGANFTDMLAEMSSQLDAADQDKALAAQVSEDRATLLSLHETVVEARAATNTIRQETAVQKQKLDQRLKELKAAQAHLKALERQAEAALARRARPVREDGRRREADAPDARGDGGGEAAPPAQDQPAGREAVQPGQHPVAVQRDAALADGRRRDPGLRLHRGRRTSRRWATAPTGTTASTSSPRTAPRSTRRAPAASSTSAGTTPTAPTRRGS